MSLREDILSMDDLESREVVVRQWDNKKVIVKSITAAQRYEMIEQCMNTRSNKIDGKKLYIYTLISCTYDPETGTPLFTVADYDKLAAKNSGAIEAIVAVANELNGIGEAQIVELEKN
jgi:hypothetical protein